MTVPVETTEAVDLARPPLDERILAVTRELAMVQALAPETRDDTGFSNGDYPTGFVLAAAGNVEECAHLLTLYPRQAEGAGLDLAELRGRALGLLSNTEPAPAEETPAMRRVVARTALRNARERFAGQLHWVETPDGVLFNGVGLASAARAALARTVRTPAGWLVSKDPMFLHRFFDALGADGRDALVRCDDLYALAGSRPVDLTPAKAPKITTVSHRVVGTTATFEWTQPFSDEGKALRERLKQFGARYNGNKGFDVSTVQVPRIAYGAILVNGVFLSPELQAIASELDGTTRLAVEERITALEAGLTVYEVLKQEGDVVYVSSSGKRDDAYTIFREHNLQWDRDLSAYKVPMCKLPGTIAALSALPKVELGELVDLAHRTALRLADEDATRRANQPTLPALTPTGREFLPKQREMVEFLLDRTYPRGKIFGHAPGTGKSGTSAVAAHLLTEPDPSARIVIITNAHLRLNWLAEIQKFVGDREFIQVIEGHSAHISKNYRWTIINYDIVAANIAKLRALNPRIVMLDEGDKIRNDTHWSKALIGDRETPGWLAEIPEVWPLSGSEIRNRPRELWNLLNAIKHPLGENFFKFGVRYCAGHEVSIGDKTVWDFSGASNLAELGRVVAPYYSRYELHEVWPACPKHIDDPTTVTMSTEERKTYKAALDDALRTYKTGRADALTAMTAERLATAMIKVPHTIKAAEHAIARGEALGIFSSFAQALDRFEEHFGSRCVRIDGSMDAAKKHEMAVRFQTDPSITAFLGQTQASGTGFTLTRGRRSLLNDLPFTPDDITQAEARFLRITQTDDVYRQRMRAPGTGDDFLEPMLEAKRSYIDAFRRAARGEVVDEADLAPPPSLGSIVAQLALFLEQREQEESQDRRRVTAAVPPGASATVAHMPTVSA